MEPTAEQINEFYDYFTPIYDENGKEINPLPDDRKITVWCESGKDVDEQGFAYNVTDVDMGIEILIAKAWISQEKLDSLIKNYGTVDKQQTE